MWEGGFLDKDPQIAKAMLAEARTEKRKQEFINSAKAAEAKRVKLVTTALDAWLDDSQDTLNVLKNKYFGDLSKLTVPQMESVIIRQTNVYRTP